MILKVKITEEDIRLGRERVDYTCGCVVWRALRRALTEKGFNTETLEVDWYHKARVGNARIRLPRKVEVFQKTLLDHPNANVKPFTFEIEVL